MKIQLPSFSYFLLPSLLSSFLLSSPSYSSFLQPPIRMNWNPIQQKDADLDVLHLSFGCRWKMLWILRDREKHFKTFSSLLHTDWLSVGLCQPLWDPPLWSSLLNCFSVARVGAGCHQLAWEMVFVDLSPSYCWSPASPYALVGSPNYLWVEERDPGRCRGSKKHDNRPFTGTNFQYFSIIWIYFSFCVLLFSYCSPYHYNFTLWYLEESVLMPEVESLVFECGEYLCDLRQVISLLKDSFFFVCNMEVVSCAIQGDSMKSLQHYAWYTVRTQ